MAVRKHEEIAIGPDRVLRVKFEDTIQNRVDERRERHRRSGVPGVGLLHGIDGERANRVDAQLIEFCGAQIFNWSYCGTHDCLRGKYSNSISDSYAGTAEVSAPTSLAAFFSSPATLLRRLRWRSAWLNSAARKVSTRSQATMVPITRPPRQIMFM